MKLTCTVENFKKAILNSERVVSKQTTLPVLNNILFEASKKGLKLSATNLEIGVEVRVGAKIEEEGKITIPAKVISSFTNNLPIGENLTIEADEQKMRIKAGSFKAVIKGLPAGEFPLIPRKNTDFQIQLEGEILRQAISKIMVSVALNEMRQELTGINIILKEEELLFASTDSFRLSEVRVALKKENINKDLYKAFINKKNSLILPATTALEVSRVLLNNENNEVKIAIEEGQIFFDVNGITIVSRLINGKYPEYKHIMPAEFKTRAVGEKSLFQNALKMAGIFSSGKSSEISLKIDKEKKKAVIEARSVEAGENTSEINLDITGPSQDAVFNSKYLLDGTNIISTTNMAILLNTSASPAAIREIDENTGEVLMDYTYIVMPIKN